MSKIDKLGNVNQLTFAAVVLALVGKFYKLIFNDLENQEKL